MNLRSHYLFSGILYFLMLSVGLFLQLVVGLEPCPLCILQRMAVIATGLVAWVAFIHAPITKGINKIYLALLSFGAATSVGIAARHIWLQHLPPEEAASCGPGLEIWLDNVISYLPQGALTETLFRSTAECAEVSWSLFGLSLPELTLAPFIVVLSYFLWLFTKRISTQ